MTDLPVIFRSEDALQRRFVLGLDSMLQEHAGLGVFILALANASYDERIQERLGPALQDRFQQESERLRNTLAAGRQPLDAADDLDVFLRLMALGMGDLPPTRFRQAGRFQVQFNLLRALRPPRMAGVRVERIGKPFDPEGFHFNRPFLRKEVLWEGDLLGQTCRLLYNKFPFAHLHALLVIEPRALAPQFVSREAHRLVWNLCENAGAALPGLGFGYNSYGAYASVNHQHFQMFLHPGEGYPVEEGGWQHNGGSEPYPVTCQKAFDREAAWDQIDALQRRNTAFNLLYRPGCLYVLPRRFQGDYEQAPWTSGFAWSELAGAVTTFNREDFLGLDEEDVRRELAALRLD